MPTSAIESGLIDFVLPIEETPGKLLVYATVISHWSDQGQELQATNGAREGICAILCDQIGHDLAGYKEPSFLRRVRRRMQVVQRACAISWSRNREGPEERLLLLWRESGGPPVTEPSGKGFGSGLVQRQTRHHLQGEVNVAFRPEGLQVELCIPWRPELLV
jgi:hypothetical protein